MFFQVTRHALLVTPVILTQTVPSRRNNKWQGQLGIACTCMCALTHFCCCGCSYC